MAADITLLFKASVKTVKTRNKALGLTETSSAKRPRQRNTFSSKAKEVISNISKLKDFLLQHRKDYVNAGSLMSSDVSRMTDGERDQIDQDAQIFMRTCADAISQLRSETDRQVVSSQVKDHRAAVLDLIDVYLKGVCKLYSEQRAVRVKRVVDKKRLSRLEPELLGKEKKQSDVEESNEKAVSDGNVDLWEDSRVEDDLSPEEIQMFEQENQRLVGEMNSLLDEVRHIEGKVVEISRLQEIFAEKVLQQETEIDNIHQLVVGATENVKEGNEDIREAMKNNAGFRVWIIFFLVMCSFSLLFLDWYG
ncbi:syntaxin-18 isoform X1 [Misgurnus anguillicaudatus]|uniref:syntaxin-18 isoform X1 n=2 Tax=Misgurnus anguillicaudatus TaxID=75329 RepID=UPI002435F439|nr:syntaxin-18 isoform X1 [Misgurnus anguillicaudatus]